MFAPSFARAVRSSASVSATPAGPLCRAALSTAPTPFHPLHQRRYSSSKSSVPPSSKKKPEELKQPAAAQLHVQERGAQSKDKVTEMPPASSTNNVARVPSTTHRHDDDVRLSSFFSLHRPMPFYREAWQQQSSMDVFDALFDQSAPSDPQAIQRTSKTLSDFVQNLYAGLDAQDELQADAVLFLDDAKQHHEGPPTEESIEFYASQLPHFVPPPPPVAFDPTALQPHPFTTRVMSERITEVELPSEQTGRSTTFREHVRRRRGGMLLISVKRQRKLKMKKHKYKKLMKRTRLERRKLDRN